MTEFDRVMYDGLPASANDNMRNVLVNSFSYQFVGIMFESKDISKERTEV